MEAVLIANLSPLALTTSITNGQDLLLYRTLDLPEDPNLRLQEVQRGIAVAAAYYEDKLGVVPALFAGITPASEGEAKRARTLPAGSTTPN
jgi:type IV pilus assembly protein PilM